MLAEAHTVLNDSLGQVRVLELPDGRRSISVAPKPGRYLRRVACVTTYPLDLIKEIHATKGIFVCSEIMREEDPRLVESSIRHGVLSYFEPPRFAGKRILDFGCGAGASSLV